MFSLADTPLDPRALTQTLADTACGACVTFEGWVRDTNEGRSVHRLDYEAYPAVAIAEGNRILADACARHGLRHAACAHRVGTLAPGDLAVWVGAVAPHRAEAFAACRGIIDAIKHEVPIWKKEHYTDGDAGWVNCGRCAHAGRPTLTPAAYYARQSILPEVGETGQRRLAEARVLVVGAGGLGCGALPALAAAGVGLLGVCDGDRVDVSNLHRQTLYTAADIGAPKAEVAARRLRALNPLIECHAHPRHLGAANAEDLVARYDLILDCTDNFEAKYQLNDLAVRQGKALVQAAIHQYEGQLFVHDPQADAACMRCLWPDPPAPGCVVACAEAGVLGAVPAVFGALQALEALKLLLRLPGRLHGEMLYMDLLTHRTRRVPVVRRPGCPACGPQAETAAPMADEDLDLRLRPEDLQGYTLVDIREHADAGADPLDGVPHLARPVSAWESGAVPLARGPRYVLCCAQGWRSRALARALRREGYDAYSLHGGLRDWRNAP